MSTPAVLQKQPEEKRLFTMDFSEVVPTGVTISSATAAATTVGNSTSDLTLGGTSISGTDVTLFIEGGTHGRTYRVEITVTLSNSEVIIGAGTLRVLTR